MKKYEFTGETKEIYGVTLHRIRAVRDFANVCAGDMGGWIEKEDNLSQEGTAQVCGNAWVYGDAQVYGNARVYGDARVCGTAQVYGDAQVFGDALVYGNAQVCDDAQVFDGAWVYGDAWVFGDALVYGNAQVCDDSQVFGDALVYGNAKVYGGAWGVSPLYIQGTRWSINISSPNSVCCGCQNHTFQEWHDRYKAISRIHGADDVLDEYIQYFNLICRRYGHEDFMIEAA